ncbi:Hypothetical predicted protein, partial [Pelobates cultripes]
SRLSQVLENGQMIDYNTLKSKYNLPSTAFFSYLQIKSWINKYHDNKQTQGNTLTEIELLCMAKKPPQQLLSTLYGLIGQSDHTEKLTFIKTWEKEIDQNTNT